jgi:hypothetical protein
VTTRSPRPSEHLGYYDNSDGDLGLMVYPDILFLDFEDAIVKSGLLNRGLTFKYLTRLAHGSTHKKGKKIVYYNFDKASLESSLVKQGHANM